MLYASEMNGSLKFNKLQFRPWWSSVALKSSSIPLANSTLCVTFNFITPYSSTTLQPSLYQDTIHLTLAYKSELVEHSSL